MLVTSALIAQKTATVIMPGDFRTCFVCFWVQGHKLIDTPTWPLGCQFCLGAFAGLETSEHPDLVESNSLILIHILSNSALQGANVCTEQHDFLHAQCSLSSQVPGATVFISFQPF